MKKILISLIVLFVIMPACKAESYEDDIISKSVKYFKTITYQPKNSVPTSLAVSYTYVIDKTEYDNSNKETENRNSATVETNYKKMTTSITKNGNYYRFKNVLHWKSIPSTRSYDIIGIGHYQSVSIYGTTHFNQEYCFTSGTCSNSTTNYPQIFSSGSGTSFQLPTGSLSSLDQTFYFDVQKNTSATITTLKAVGDYSHATSNISLANSKKYTVNISGISLDNSIFGYYDSITSATVTQNVTW